jgi:hypothetical protein|tara:strand:+ start:1712 stop:2095 length:384 start_codon:yes stop_codon:yes gene_type:complete
MKREFTSIRWSDFPRREWVRIVIPCPAEYSSIAIPQSGLYIGYKAYFPFVKDKRLFNLVIPYYKFQTALEAVPPELRNNLNQAVQFEIMRNGNGDVLIQNWEILAPLEAKVPNLDKNSKPSTFSSTP